MVGALNQLTDLVPHYSRVIFSEIWARYNKTEHGTERHSRLTVTMFGDGVDFLIRFNFRCTELVNFHDMIAFIQLYTK